VRLQVSSRLAIFALLELACRPDRQLSVAQIGKKYGVSNHHLAKVMHTLGRSGLVRSVRGAGGGYQFSGKAKRTTLLDVIQLFEEPGITETAADDSTREGRALNTILGEIDDIARATLGSITLTTLLKLIERNNAPRSRQRAPRDAPRNVAVRAASGER
jgi:Rrf2 family protein